VQRRVTVTFKQEDGHVRKSTTPEQGLRTIYEALGLETNPGGVKKLIVTQKLRNVGNHSGAFSHLTLCSDKPKVSDSNQTADYAD